MTNGNEASSIANQLDWAQTRHVLEWLILGFYDGPLNGIVKLGGPEEEYAFEMLAGIDRDDGEVRLMELWPLKPGTLEKVRDQGRVFTDRFCRGARRSVYWIDDQGTVVIEGHAPGDWSADPDLERPMHPELCMCRGSLDVPLRYWRLNVRRKLELTECAALLR